MAETQVTMELMRAISAAFNSRDVERIVDRQLLFALASANVAGAAKSGIAINVRP